MSEDLQVKVTFAHDTDLEAMVREFMEAGQQVVGVLPGLRDVPLRRHLIEDEVDELYRSLDDNDLVETADALMDLLYVVVGACIAFGLPIKPLFEEVHRSNMTKIVPDNEMVFGQHKKIGKPSTYSPPDLESILGRIGGRD